MRLFKITWLAGTDVVSGNDFEDACQRADIDSDWLLEGRDYVEITPTDADLEELLACVVERKLEEDSLDEIVHEAKGREASALNNSGFEAQVKYLLSAFGKDGVLHLLPRAQ